MSDCADRRISGGIAGARRERIAHADEVFVSAASIWEASIKVGLSKLDADVNALVAGIDGIS